MTPGSEEAKAALRQMIWDYVRNLKPVEGLPDYTIPISAEREDADA